MINTLPVWGKTEDPTTGVFLEISPGARAISLGDAYTASGEDPTMVFYNPAGIAERSFPEATLTRYNFFNGMEYNFIAGEVPLGRYGHFGGAFTFIRLSTAARDIFGNEVGTIRPKDYVLTLTYAKKLLDNFNIGGSFKYGREDLIDFKQSLIAFDMGAMYKIPIGMNRDIKLAFSVRNLGRVLPAGDDNDPLPLVATFGFMAQPIQQIKIYGEGYLPEHADAEVGAGLEYGFNDFIFVRAGFRWSPDMSGTEIFRGGFGMKIGEFGEIDYAYRPREDFGVEHRFSFTMRTGQNIGFQY